MKPRSFKPEAAIGDLFTEASSQVQTHAAASSKTSLRPTDVKKTKLAGTFFTVDAVAERYKVSRATIWRWVQNDELFPEPVRLSPGTSRWSEGQLLEFEERAVLRQSDKPSKTKNRSVR